MILSRILLKKNQICPEAVSEESLKQTTSKLS